MSVTQSDLLCNGIGVRVSICGGLNVTASTLRENRHEAAQVQNDCPQNMTPRPIALNDSNIVDNATVGGGVIGAPALAATTQNATHVISGPWPTPHGEIVEQIYWSYDQTQFGSGTGTIRSSSGTVVLTESVSNVAFYWRDISSFGVTDLVIDLTGTMVWYVSMYVSQAFYYEFGYRSAAVVFDSDVTVDFRRNYWGTSSPVFVDPRSKIDASSPRSVPAF
jgi:hypothetical protein